MAIAESGMVYVEWIRVPAAERHGPGQDPRVAQHGQPGPEAWISSDRAATICLYVVLGAVRDPPHPFLTAGRALVALLGAGDPGAPVLWSALIMPAGSQTGSINPHGSHRR